MSSKVSQPKSTAPSFVPFRWDGGRSHQIAAVAGAAMGEKDRLFNRDLSWLHFNDRVLNEAADPSVPALERLRFATIVSSNLDEFFMIRVAEISRLARQHPNHRFPDGLTAAQALAQIREEVLRQKANQAAILEEILAVLRGEGIHIYYGFERSPRLNRQIKIRLPKLSICIRRSSEPLPPLASARIHIFVRFPGAYAIIAIEEREGRLIELPRVGRVRRYALAE